VLLLYVLWDEGLVPAAEAQQGMMLRCVNSDAVLSVAAHVCDAFGRVEGMQQQP